MNYLGLIGLLGPDGRARRRAGAGRRADRRPRRRRADGGVRDHGGAARARRRRAPGAIPARAKGSSSTCRCPTARCRGWRWSPARTSPTATVPRRGELPLAGSLVCYRPYECADGWVSLGALEPKFWQALCRGVGPRGADRDAVRAPGLARPTRRCRRSSSRARASSGRSSRANTTAAWSRCWSSTRRCPRSSCASARWSSRSTSPGPSSRCASWGCRSSSTRTPGDHARLPGPALGEHTEEVLLAAGYSPEQSRRAAAPRRGRRPAERDAAPASAHEPGR